MAWDSLQEILYALRQNKLRTGLTAFGVFWGIFMLILLLGAGDGLQKGVKKGFSSDIRTALWIWASKTSVPYMGQAHGRTIQFTERDMQAIRKEIHGVQYVAAENGSRKSMPVIFGRKSGSFPVMGVSEDYFKIKVKQDYLAGRRLNAFDGRDTRKVATMGIHVAERLFPQGTDPIGQYIQVNDIGFQVVGLFYDSGWQGRQSERVYIPLSTYQKTFGDGRTVAEIEGRPSFWKNSPK